MSRESLDFCVIGITGGIASGKSTLLKLFRAEGVAGVDSDLIVHQLLCRGTKVYSAVVETFGEEYLNSEGILNRKKLGRKVFSNRVARRKLEGIVHPAVFAAIARETQRLRRRGRRQVAVDIPLLFETHATSGVDVIAVAYVPRSIQLKRLRRRNLTPSEAMARIRAQWSLERKRRRADIVFDMRKSLTQIKREVRSWLRERRQKRTR